MKLNSQDFIKDSRIFKAGWKAAAIAVIAGLSLSVAAGAALAGDHEDRHAGEYRKGGRDEIKFYGTVEKLPQDLVGIWIVNGREIVVSANTIIKEKHGQAEAGAYVEVEGHSEGNTLTAYEIEVKRSIRSGR